jgi:hypothetical protein
VLLRDGLCIRRSDLLGKLELEADEIEAARAEVHGGERVGFEKSGIAGAHLGQQHDGALGMKAQIVHLRQQLGRNVLPLRAPGIEPEKLIAVHVDLALPRASCAAINSFRLR